MRLWSNVFWLHRPKAITLTLSDDAVMNLSDYVNDVLNKRGYATSFPDTLVLSKDLAGDFYRLWEDGEKRAIEVGYNLTVAGDEAGIDKTKRFDGGPYSIDITWQSATSNFGDVHSHPANSIGHVNGYSAHSVQDIRAIENDKNKDKPLFIRFVASGYYAYAIIFRRGHSEINVKKLNSMVDHVFAEIKKLFLEKNKLSEDEYTDKLSTFTSTQLFEAWMLDTKKKTPGFGPEVMRLSIKHCTDIAKDMKLGFYQGFRGLGGWVAGSEMTLTLVK